MMIFSVAKHFFLGVFSQKMMLKMGKSAKKIPALIHENRFLILPKKNKSDIFHKNHRFRKQHDITSGSCIRVFDAGEFCPRPEKSHKHDLEPTFINFFEDAERSRQSLKNNVKISNAWKAMESSLLAFVKTYIMPTWKRDYHYPHDWMHAYGRLMAFFNYLSYTLQN